MKKIFLIVFGISLLGLNSCSVLEQAQEYERFIQCDFSFKSVNVLDVNGINVQNISKPEDIPMLQVMALSQSVMSGSLPATISVDLQAKNNNVEKASIEGMKWKIMLKEDEFLNGILDKSIVVEANASTVFPIKANIDVLKLAQSNSLNEVWNLVFAEDKMKVLRDLGVSFQLKPMYKVNGETMEYPGYITIKP